MKPFYLAFMTGLALMTGVSVAPAAEQSVLNIGLQDDPDTLDPATNWSFVGRHVLQSLCDKIVDIDAQGQIVPMLAESWEWSADGKVLTCIVRHGATFHDGEPVNAAAIKYNLDRDLTLDISRRKAEISSIASVDVVDDYTVKINLKQASVPLLAAFSDRAGHDHQPEGRQGTGRQLHQQPGLLGPVQVRRARCPGPHRSWKNSRTTRMPTSIISTN